MRRIMAAGVGAVLLMTAPAEARTFRVSPGANAQVDLQAALSGAKPGDQVRLARGRFELGAGLLLDIDRVSIRGEGQDKSILSFTGQTGDAAGLTVTADDVVLRDFGVENAHGDGIASRDADRITFQDLRVEWAGGPKTGNGAFGISPVGSRDVLVNRVIVRGASNAGIHVAQSQNVIVRRSTAELNVAGVAIENSINADVYDNVMRRNVAGVVVLGLPDAQQTGVGSTRIFRNQIVQNDAVNVAPPDAPATTLQTGTGVMIVASRNVHVFENTIAENGTANVIITAYRRDIADPAFNALPRDVVVRDNQFGRGGFAPVGDFAALRQAGVPFGDIVWDGATIFVAGGQPREEPVRISIKDNRSTTNRPVSFLSLGLSVASSPVSEAQPDATMPPPLVIAEPPPVRLPQD